MAAGKVFGANEKIRMGVIGFRGRGKEHIAEWLNHPESEIVAMCDVDQSILDKGIATVKAKQEKEPKAYKDLRDLLADPNVDAVSIATPNHWHTLAAQLAMEAGKDVYVEKPCSHNVWEGRQLVNTARKTNRICQHGTQIRSSAGIQDAVQKLRDGVLGDVYLGRGLCYKTRNTIGHKPVEPVPAGVDYNLWLGPAPEHEFTQNRFHYNWHYMWDYGNGDLGNQGVHQMDIVRWGLGVGLPSRVSAMGGMFLFDDDKEVPNTITTSFWYPDAGKKGVMLEFEVRPWLTNFEGATKIEDKPIGGGAKVGDKYVGGGRIAALFYGSEGYMVIDSYGHYQTFLGDKGEPGPSNDAEGDHFGNFLAAVKARDPKMLNAEIEEGHRSAALCHLGLISARVGRSLNFDPKTETIVGDDEASQYLTRKYREPFVVKEVKA
jgi:predicted dehydrogenase